MPEHDGQPIGDIIDSLGVRSTPKEGDLVSGAVVLLKVVEPDGGVRMSVTWSEGMSWLERAGMLRVAELLESADQEKE